MQHWDLDSVSMVILFIYFIILFFFSDGEADSETKAYITLPGDCKHPSFIGNLPSEFCVDYWIEHNPAYSDA